MSETGATASQIEAAVARACKDQGGCPDFSDLYRSNIAHSSTYLVPPGALILDAEDAAAVRYAAVVVRQLLDDAKAGDEYLTELLSECFHYFPTSDADNGSYSDHVDRLAALVGGA